MGGSRPPPPPDDVQVATPAAGIGAPAVGLGAQSATWVQAGGLAGATPKAPPGVAPPQVVLPPWKGQRAQDWGGQGATGAAAAVPGSTATAQATRPWAGPRGGSSRASSSGTGAGGFTTSDIRTTTSGSISPLPGPRGGWVGGRPERRDLVRRRPEAREEGEEGQDPDEGEEKAHQKRMKAMPTKLHGTNWELPKEMMGLRLVKDRAPMYKWEYPLYDDSRRSYAGFLRSPWNPEGTRGAVRALFQCHQARHGVAPADHQQGRDAAQDRMVGQAWLHLRVQLRTLRGPCGGVPAVDGRSSQRVHALLRAERRGRVAQLLQHEPLRRRGGCGGLALRRGTTSRSSRASSEIFLLYHYLWASPDLSSCGTTGRSQARRASCR
ncbi:unnamed protein product [Prorocentrum cordatum]|uniref:Uncharacterized protein n=1 Tax=Prorocentrum cordatum TaxID=2364126 RepID=A0ABN9SKV1_9DINO|nr:unnamed protein product [Polarella glacialis]